MWQLWHLALLGLATAAIGSSGLQVASLLVVTPATRLLGGVVVAATSAVIDALVLGLFGLGSNPAALTIAAVATWLVCQAALPTRQGPSVWSQLGATWREASPPYRAATGAIAAAFIGWTAFLLHAPAVGFDGLSYHLTEPAIWVTNGHPGSMHPTYLDVPVQAYPRTMEVLFAWAISLGRTAEVTVPITVGCFAFLLLGMATCLRSLRVSLKTSWLASIGFLLIPLVVTAGNGVLTDIPALAWLVGVAAFAAAATTQPSATPLAILAIGLAIGTKTTTGPLCLMLAAVMVWRQRGWIRAHLVGTGASIAAGIGAGGIWYLVDWARYGAPLYPFSGFPSGTRPVLFNGLKFISAPVAVARATGLHGYVDQLGGGLVLFAGIVAAIIATLITRERRAWRLLAGGTLLIAVLLLLWAVTPYSELLTGLRYILPAPLVAAFVLALMTRYGRGLRWTSIAFLIAAVVADAIGLHTWHYPNRPTGSTAIAFVAVCAAVGALAALVRNLPATRFIRPACAGLVVIGCLGLAVPAHSFDSRHIAVSRQLSLGDADLLSWFVSQPGWETGKAPIAIGPVVFATLAGPRFSHPLSLISDTEPCGAVTAAAHEGWAIVQVLHDEPVGYGFLNYSHAVSCLAGLKPLTVIPGTGLIKGTIQVYGPASFAPAS